MGGDELLDDGEFVSQHDFLVGVGDQRLRRRLAALVRENGGTLTSVVHPSAVVAPDVRIGVGTVVLAGSVINTGAALGDLVIVQIGATVDHDDVLEDGVQVCPGAVVIADVPLDVTAVGSHAKIIKHR